MYRIIWNPDYEYAGHRNSLAETRPTEIDADRYEISANNDGMYLVVINFFKNDRPVAALFQTPVAILTLANIQE